MQFRRRRKRDRRTVPVPSTSRRVRRRVFMGIVVVLVIVPVWSYVNALRAPGTDSTGARTAEWLRDHHLGGAVNSAEHWWYAHHPPPTGGQPAHGIPNLAAVAPLGTIAQRPTRMHPSSTTMGAHAIGLDKPAAIAPIAQPPLAHEGVWQAVGPTPNGYPSMYATYVRPDAAHTSLLAGVAWFDPTLLTASLVPGLAEPSAADRSLGAKIPESWRSDLVAAFNSAFRVKDARGGYFANGHVYTPLRAGAASLVIGTDGAMTIANWGRDVTSLNRVAAVRQNLDLIADNGVPVAGLPNNADGRWGNTLGNKVFVWRSGVGVTASGAVVYVAGNGLSVASLANILTRAGAVRAMELDINPEWVSCYVYNHPSIVSPSDVVGQKLLGSSQRPADRYLVPGTRDFIVWRLR